MGSPSFAVPSLEALHSSHHSVAAVVTQPDRPSGRGLRPQPPPVKLTAHSLGIPVFQPATTRTAEFVAEIQSFQPDVLVVVAYGEILRKNLLATAPLGAINLHASLLPKYRGAAPVTWAILQGETQTGVTIMQMDEGMDSGPILLQAPTMIHPTDTTQTLTDRLAILGAPLLKQTLDSVERHETTPKAQDSSLVSFAPKLKKEHGWIDWNKDAASISRQTRAFDPWPGSFSLLEKILIKFWLAHPVGNKTDENAGTIVKISKESFWIACGGGTVLNVIEVQPENRPRLTAADFVHGYRVQVGIQLQSVSVKQA